VRALAKLRDFLDFSPGDDPYGEHDFGAFELSNERFFFKIDYYDRDLENGSSDPADPEQTTRVLTVMLASDYCQVRGQQMPPFAGRLHGQV
jgi:hypothetical protein